MYCSAHLGRALVSFLQVNKIRNRLLATAFHVSNCSVSDRSLVRPDCQFRQAESTDHHLRYRKEAARSSVGTL